MQRAWMKRKPSLWKGIVAGTAGGLAASWLMGQFHGVASKTSEKLMPKDKFRELRRAAADAQDATAKAAERVTRPLLGRRLRSIERERAKSIVHYGFGSAVGALYGASSEYVPFVRKFAGAPFGAAVFAGAGQIALPALNLTKSPHEYPWRCTPQNSARISCME